MASWEIKSKKIGKIDQNDNKVYDATDKVVLPGIIDTQVHFREPGSTDAEDLESGSRAAVLGGVTSLFEMPNTNPPTANLIEFEKKLQAAKNRMHSNYAFYFGATPNNTEQLAQLKMLRDVVVLNFLQVLPLEICWLIKKLILKK